MREYTFDEYINITEKNPHPILAKNMQAELDIISSIKNSQDKTFIDLGAGHGRIVDDIASIADKLISIEINPDMLPELRKRSAKHQNAEVLVGDITKLSKLLQDYSLSNPVFLILQNTLGTIEGSWKKVLEETRKIGVQEDGEVVLSFFRQEALKGWGMDLYDHVGKMTGKPDLEKTDFSKGIFVSQTGYKSKWRSKEEIEDIKEFFGGEVIEENWTDNWCVIHLNI